MQSVLGVILAVTSTDNKQQFDYTKESTIYIHDVVLLRVYNGNVNVKTTKSVSLGASY